MRDPDAICDDDREPDKAQQRAAMQVNIVEDENHHDDQNLMHESQDGLQNIDHHNIIERKHAFQNLRTVALKHGRRIHDQNLDQRPADQSDGEKRNKEVGLSLIDVRVKASEDRDEQRGSNQHPQWTDGRPAITDEKLNRSVEKY